VRTRITTGVAAAVLGSALLAGSSTSASAAAAGPGAARASGAAAGLRATGTALAKGRLPFRLTGRRMALLDGTRKVDETTNWAGYGGVLPKGYATGVQGRWTVPDVAAEPQGYSSTWVGMDGMTSRDRDVIQVGTEQDSGPTGYFAWVEVSQSDAASPIVTADSGRPATVKPGDDIRAGVREDSPGRWSIAIEDLTQNWFYSGTVGYPGPGASAEWIEEAPMISNGYNPYVQSTPADFGTVHFADSWLYLPHGGAGPGWYATDLQADNGLAMTDASYQHVLAWPDRIYTNRNTTEQRFAVTYVHRPGIPRDLQATAEVKAVKLTWKAPTSDGGMRISLYRLREYANGTLVRKWTVGAVTSAVVHGLTPAAAYNFQIAAANAGRWTGNDTRWTAKVRPRS
jgi:hypothetical protein